MKIYFTIFCFLFVFSASSQTSLWTGMESPATGNNIANISQLGDSLILTQYDSIPYSNGTMAIFTYVWNGHKWDTLPYLQLKNQFVSFPYKPILYKNKVCHRLPGNSMLVKGNYVNLAIWQDSSWEEIPFKYYDSASIYFEAYADSMGLYIVNNMTSGSWTKIKYYKYNDSDWTSYYQQQYDLHGWSDIVVHKGQLYFTEMQNIGGQTMKQIVLRFNGIGIDTILYKDAGNSNMYLASVSNELLLLGEHIYRFDGKEFTQMDDSDLPIGYMAPGGAFFSYKNSIIGYVNINTENIAIRYNGSKWLRQSNIFDVAGFFYGIWSHGDRIILASQGSIFPLSGKPNQCLGYIDNLKIVKGKVYNDVDNTCSFSATNKSLTGLYIYNEFGNIYSDKQGNFEDLIPEGKYTFKPANFSNYYRYWKSSPCFPDSIVINVNDSSENKIHEFPIQRKANSPDLATYLSANIGNRARRGFEESYTVSCRNWGSVKQPAQLYLYYPSHLQNLIFSINPDSIKSNYVCWNVDSMELDSIINIDLLGTFDTTYFHDSDSIYFYAKFLPENNDSFIYDNRDTIKQYIVSSWDPNFKCAMPGDMDGNAVIQPGVKQLNYTIHFENTGTDTAYNIKVVDVLDSTINPFSIYTTASSDEYNMSVYKNTVTWQFNNIKLSPKDNANSNNHLSEGFVSYRVNLKNDFPIGTQINNTADIYFDYNAPVQTNTSVVLINQTTSSSYVRLQSEYNTFEVYPNPANDKLYISAENVKTISIYNLLGELVYQSNFVLSKPIDISALAKGLYLLKAENTLGEKSIVKFVKE